MPATTDTAFEQLVTRHRRELYVHCYRMLGCAHDAEDALQEALVAAWRGLPDFEGRSSARTWLYTVTTNACLRLIERRPRRIVSTEFGPSCPDPSELGAPVTDAAWLEPLADDPAERYARRESVELAYVAALQHLPGSQRAVLILREVLQFSAAEAAAMLGSSVASVNSALQRARAAVAERIPATSQQAELAQLTEDGRRDLVDAFVAAWERADIPALLDLLVEDAQFTMPPLPAWFDGHAEIARFLGERMFALQWRLVPTSANGQLAFACYSRPQDGDEFALGAINVLRLRDGKVAAVDAFLDPTVHELFGLPKILAADR